MFALLALLLLAPTRAPLGAQQLDSVRAGLRRPAAGEAPDRRAPTVIPAATDSVLTPPISPRRAFLYSFVLPGAGQAKLDRGYAGGMFFLIEATAIALAHRSAEDLRVARAFRDDSVPLRYDVNPTTGLAVLDAEGNPRVSQWSSSRYDEAYVKTRRLHYEDWLAVLFFNHLFAGADAFVAAQLWDLPGKVGLRQTPFGPLIQATIPFR